jgi:hypothetical protein
MDLLALAHKLLEFINGHRSPPVNADDRRHVELEPLNVS